MGVKVCVEGEEMVSFGFLLFEYWLIIWMGFDYLDGF